MKYPPVFSEENLQNLISEVKDWQITHGSLLKLVDTDDEHTVLSRPVGCTLYPTPFPRHLFDEALSLQSIYNKLYAAVAQDPEWLSDVLEELVDVDPLANTLWTIYQKVIKEGLLQDMSLGIFRSDYMIQSSDDSNKLELKQVEFNTVSCAGGVHGNLVSDMHQHLNRTGIYEQQASSAASQGPTIQLDASSLPTNSTRKTIARGLENARRLYDSTRIPISDESSCILFIVQSPNFNIADERPIEYALLEKGIPCFRVVFGSQVLSHTSLTLNEELFYEPPNSSVSMEVSVVYFRAGFEDREYDDAGHKARFQLEKSRAIKCPSLLSHLTTFKKVQQALTLPNALSRFLSPKECERVSRTFVPQYPLDDSELGNIGRNLAMNPETVRNHILKPSREGGGHNYYGEDILKFLKATPKEMWHQYILMEKIQSPSISSFLISPRGMYQGPVISELGVFGVCLWKSAPSPKKAEILFNLDDRPCCSFKTKDASINEMSVVKGYGCFDSPVLVDDDIFASLVEINSRLSLTGHKE